MYRLPSSRTTHAALAALGAALLALVGCDRPPTEPVEPEGTDTALAPQSDTAAPALGAALPPDTLGDAATLEALIGDAEIPYPLYPDGSRYRVGSENGLRIVLFETEDSFAEVDAFYRERTDGENMPRLPSMEDYVRYARAGEDDDPWATARPGIVIHRFRDAAERAAVGADEDARTNIIVSF